MTAVDSDIFIVAGAALTATAATVLRRVSRNLYHETKRIWPPFPRAGILRPASLLDVTAWKQLVSCSTSTDFVVALNFDRFPFFNVFLSLFEMHRAQTNFGSSYTQGSKLRIHSPSMRAIILLCLLLWYLKTAIVNIVSIQYLSLYHLQPTFGWTMYSKLYIGHVLVVSVAACGLYGRKHKKWNNQRTIESKHS